MWLIAAIGRVQFAIAPIVPTVLAHVSDLKNEGFSAEPEVAELVAPEVAEVVEDEVKDRMRCRKDEKPDELEEEENRVGNEWA